MNGTKISSTLHGSPLPGNDNARSRSGCSGVWHEINFSLSTFALSVGAFSARAWNGIGCVSTVLVCSDAVKILLFFLKHVYVFATACQWVAILALCKDGRRRKTTTAVLFSGYEPVKDESLKSRLSY